MLIIINVELKYDKNIVNNLSLVSEASSPVSSPASSSPGAMPSLPCIQP